MTIRGAGAIALAAMLSVGAFLPVDRAGAAGSPRVEERRTTAKFFLAALAYHPVQHVVLTPGAWIVTAKAYAVDLHGDGDVVRCRLWDAARGDELDSSA